jgi:hypothetical protein
MGSRKVYLQRGLWEMRVQGQIGLSVSYIS